MDHDFSDLLAELFHVVRELANHRDQELAERWNQELHVFVPVVFVLKDRPSQRLEHFIVLACACHKQSVDLEGVAH